LSIELCRCTVVPQDTTRDIDVTLSSYNDIRNIKVEHIQEEADGNSEILVDTSLFVDVEFLPPQAYLPTPTSKKSGTSTTSTWS